MKKVVHRGLTLTKMSWAANSRPQSFQWQLVSMKSPGSYLSPARLSGECCLFEDSRLIFTGFHEAVGPEAILDVSASARTLDSFLTAAFMEHESLVI